MADQRRKFSREFKVEAVRRVSEGRETAVEIARARVGRSRLRLRYLDCGRRGEYALDVGARVLADRMREMGLEVRHEEFDDDHRNVGYRYDISLPALSGVLERA